MAVRRSLMTGCVFGRDTAELRRNFTTVGNLAAGNLADDWRDRRVIVGEPAAFVDQLGRLAELGIYRVMLQWLDLHDLDGLEALAALVLPQLIG
jgi:alkanesulfonate monooxygenase SsuD/methylene tetrahydromethanopterin reductase-like flavin-dependent oxidoreductase (luciferase family)